MLVVEGLSAGYGEVNALSEVSIEVRRNESVAIVGANGAGKSTLVSAICELIPTRQGRIVKDGRDIHTLPAYRRAEIGIAVVLENCHLFGELSVRQNLELALNRGQIRGSANIQFGIQEVLRLFPFMEERLELCGGSS